jgi:hypothetical protein
VTALGASTLTVGIIEGIAEATASIAGSTTCVCSVAFCDLSAIAAFALPPAEPHFVS